MTLTRDDVVNALIAEYEAHGKDAAIEMFNGYIKRFGMSQLGIRQTIIDFRDRTGLPVGGE